MKDFFMGLKETWDTQAKMLNKLQKAFLVAIIIFFGVAESVFWLFSIHWLFDKIVDKFFIY